MLWEWEESQLCRRDLNEGERWQREDGHCADVRLIGMIAIITRKTYCWYILLCLASLIASLAADADVPALLTTGAKALTIEAIFLLSFIASIGY